LNWKVILKSVGGVLIFLAVSMVTALVWALYYGESDAWAFVISIVVTGIIGLALRLLFHSAGEIRARDGFAIVTFSWISAFVFGALPFILTNAMGSVLNALFETVSGFATCGSSILSDIESLPHATLFWRSMTHWLGGMGIVMLFIAVLPLLGVGGVQLYRAEAAGPTKDKLTPRVKETARILWMTYAGLTALETVLLIFGGMSFFDALCHTFATMATGGFSTKNLSIAAFHSPYIEYVIIVFMFLAATNFALHFRAITGKVTCYFKDPEFLGFLGIWIFATLIVFGAVYFKHLYTSNAEAFRHSLFTVTSLGTCTGFVVADYETWPFITGIVFMMIMFIGGMSGSTSGAIKVYRAMVSFKNAHVHLKKLIHPQVVIPVRMGPQVVSEDLVSKIVAFVQLYVIIFIFSSLAMTAVGLDLVSACSSVITCMGGVGPGLGSVGPMDNFNHIHFIGKWVLIGDMFLGRLEIYTVLIVISRGFWKT
jgi:trk system potassium uptake protein TrkH